MKNIIFLLMSCLLGINGLCSQNVSYNQWIANKRITIDMANSVPLGNQVYQMPIYVNDSIEEIKILLKYNPQKIMIEGTAANGFYNWSEMDRNDTLILSIQAHHKTTSQQVVMWLKVKLLVNQLDSSAFLGYSALSKEIPIPIMFSKPAQENINPQEILSFVGIETNPTNSEEIIISYPDLVTELALYDNSSTQFIKTIPVTSFKKTYWVITGIPAGQYVIKINGSAIKNWTRI